MVDVPFATIDEDELVRLAKSGDRKALEEVLRGQYQRVFAICRRITTNDADAADATQEAMIGIAGGLARFDSRSRFSTWVYRAAVNASIDQLRRRKRRLRLVTASSFVKTAPGPEEVAVDAVDVDAAMNRLAPELRAAVSLRDLIGLDYSEIAAVMHVPVGTAKSRVSRARAELARLLEEGNS
jgi:RNA polymerase sigma-70 factor (ECF subfamily)